MKSRFRFSLRFALLVVIPWVAIMAALFGQWPLPTTLALFFILYWVFQVCWPTAPPPPR